MNAGVTVRALTGTAEIKLPPPAKDVGNPPLATVARDEEAGIAVLLIGRLDYREETAAQLLNKPLAADAALRSPSTATQARTA